MLRKMTMLCYQEFKYMVRNQPHTQLWSSFTPLRETCICYIWNWAIRVKEKGRYNFNVFNFTYDSNEYLTEFKEWWRLTSVW